MATGGSSIPMKYSLIQNHEEQGSYSDRVSDMGPFMWTPYPLGVPQLVYLTSLVAIAIVRAS